MNTVEGIMMNESQPSSLPRNTYEKILPLAYQDEIMKSFFFFFFIKNPNAKHFILIIHIPQALKDGCAALATYIKIFIFEPLLCALNEPLNFHKKKANLLRNSSYQK